MIKYKDFYYTTKIVGFKERNNSIPIKLYSWYIREKNGGVMQESEEQFENKEDAEYNAQENIDEYWYY